MANEYYDHTTYPAPNSLATSSGLRAELDAVEAGFDKMPALAGNGGKPVKVNANGSGLEAGPIAKADVGLANVTNDAQLKIASNLSDLNNVGAARNNLGLGTAAKADVTESPDDTTEGRAMTVGYMGLGGTNYSPIYVTNVDAAPPPAGFIRISPQSTGTKPYEGSHFAGECKWYRDEAVYTVVETPVGGGPSEGKQWVRVWNGSSWGQWLKVSIPQIEGYMFGGPSTGGGLSVRTLDNNAPYIFQAISSGGAERFTVAHGAPHLKGDGSGWTINGNEVLIPGSSWFGSMATRDTGTGDGQYRTNSQNDARFALQSGDYANLRARATTAADVGAPPVGRAISSGTGLSGGGDLTANRTLSVNYGTTAGTAAQGNDARINNGQTAYGWGNHASAGYVPTGRTISAGTGLSGGGNLTANRTISLNADQVLNNANVRTNTASSALGAVGTYAFIRRTGTASMTSATEPGSVLTYANASGQGGGATGMLSGTWRLMGLSGAASSDGQARSSLWLRIS